ESMMEDGVYIPRSTQYSFNNRYYYNPEGAIYRTLYKTRSVADESIYAPTKFTHSHISPLVRPYGRREELRENSLYYLRIIAFLQTFLGGVLLVGHVSKMILLWQHVNYSDVQLEMVAQLFYPMYCICLSFLAISTSVEPSIEKTKLTTIFIISSIVPFLVIPCQSLFIQNSREAIEIFHYRTREGMRLQMEETAKRAMISSEANHRIIRLLLNNPSTFSKWPLGIQDLSQFSSDFLLAIQFVLGLGSLTSFIHLLTLIISLILLIRLLSLQD
ncbi:hypothetical protein PRIPAC_74128, partial [Pristionchus pacificus]|uniref:Uncharacterized protein n=1 Tax=Pristionchus pacificus TaxID=54126 RepID=A0A8R1Z6A6_PRIPA